MFEKDYDKFTNYLQELHLLLINSYHQREAIKIVLKKCCKYYGADKCSIILIDTIKEKWKLAWTYDSINKRMCNSQSNEANDICDIEYWNAVLHGQSVMTINRDMIKANSSLSNKLKNVELVKYSPFGKNPSGFLVIENPKSSINEENFLLICSHLIQRLTRELKLIDLAFGLDCTKLLKEEANVLIHFFGRFEIMTVKGVITSETINSMKIVQLIECLLLKQKYNSVDLANELWPASDYKRSLNSLKRLVHRTNVLFEDISASDTKLIVFNDFTYCLNKDLKIVSDVDIFKNAAYQYQSCVSTQSKIEALMDIFEIYKGSIYGEHLLMVEDTSYEEDYVGYMNELFRILYKAENYLLVIKCSAESLKIYPYNPDAYYWLIMSLYQTRNINVAKAKFLYAKKILISEDFNLLLEKLQRKNIKI